MIEAEVGGRCVVRDTSIACKDAAGKSVAALRDLMRRLAAENRPNADDARTFGAAANRERLSKFAPCVPEALLLDLAAERAVDWRSAREVVATVARNEA
jgi:ATP-dependent Lhr-like helicase